MRVAFLCKRRYMGKDVILDRYARLYEIPFQLARDNRATSIRGRMKWGTTSLTDTEADPSLKQALVTGQSIGKPLMDDARL